jgi:hypothetical protein
MCGAGSKPVVGKAAICPGKRRGTMNNSRTLRNGCVVVVAVLVWMCAVSGVHAAWNEQTVNARWTSSVSKIVNAYYAPGAVYDCICILYEDDQGLKMAYRPTLGGTWVSELVDAYGVGLYSDMVSSSGDLYVIYAATDGTDVIHYLCWKKRSFGTNFVDGTWSTAEFVETTAPDYPSITLFQPTSSNTPSIVYGLGTNLKFAYRDGTGWHKDTLTSLSATLLGNTQIAYDTGVLLEPKITYIDGGNLKYVVHTGLAGGSFTAETIDSGVLDCQSLCLGSAHVSYYYTAVGANDLKYAKRDGAAWTKQIVDSVGDVGSYSSLRVDQNTGRIALAYYDATNRRLKYITNSGVWSTAEVVASGSVGSYCTMALYYADSTNAGCPLIAYLDEANARVKFAYELSAKIFGYVADQDSAAPISGALVKLYNGTSYTGKYAYTGTDGYFEIGQIPVGDNYSLRVTKTAYYDWASGTIPVAPGAQANQGTIQMQLIPVPNVGFFGYSIDDDNSGESIGDGDGIPEAGETIEMYVTLQNTGTGTAHNVTATISTSDAYVTFPYNTSSSYGDIAPGGSGINTNDYEFRISSSCPNGHVITFNLSISSTERSWSTSFTVTAYVNPVVNLQYYSRTINDDSYGESSGDGDGIPDAGETIEMYVYLRNSGNTTAHNVSATISTSDPYISFLYNTSSPYVDIGVGETRANTDDFEFYISSSCPYGHVATFNLNITATEGSWSSSFTVTIYRNGNPSLRYDSFVIDDDNLGNSVGNSDGIAEPGETIELYVNIRNSGTLIAHSVTATISTSDPYATFLYNTSSTYGDIDTDQVRTNSDDFDIRISQTCPNGHLMTFNLNMTASEGSWSDSFTLMVGRPPQAEDILEMTPYGHVWVALSNGTQFGNAQRWVSDSGFIYDGLHGWVPLLGDINGDGLKDLIEITPYGHIWVMLSTGASFSAPARWSTNGFIFDAGGGWIPTIGDVNGDGMDDLIETTPYGHIWVMLSTGSGFGTQTRWAVNGFINDAVNGWIIILGDFNGDHRCDLLQVTPYGHCWVSLSTGSSFGAPTRWAANGFIFDSVARWIPSVGDLNGDGRDDMFEYTPYGHIWVSLSTGSTFATPTRWATNGFIFDAANGWLPSVADVNGDGMKDTLEFTPYGDVWVSLSTGSSFATPTRWGAPGFIYDGATGWIPMTGNVGP